MRQFSKLQTLSLKGNPLATNASYHSFVIAYIPSLVYLDFRMIMDEEVQPCSMSTVATQILNHDRLITILSLTTDAFFVDLFVDAYTLREKRQRKVS